MTVLRNTERQRLLQQILTNGGVDQVDTANDMSDFLCGVIDDDGKLIRPEAVAATNNKITDFISEVIAVIRLQAIVQSSNSAGAEETPGEIMIGGCWADAQMKFSTKLLTGTGTGKGIALIT